MRLFGNTFVPAYILEAESLLEWLRDIWPSKTTNPDLVSLPDICNIGPNKIRRKEPAMSALKTLEDHGWLVKEKNGVVINEKHRKDVWRIRREFFDPPVEKQGKPKTLAGLNNSASLEFEGVVLPENQYEGPLTGDGCTQTLAAPPTMEKNLEAEGWEGINV